MSGQPSPNARKAEGLSSVFNMEDGANLERGQLQQRPRITPRNSNANDTMTEEAKETPYDTLHRLANIIPRPVTPLRRASSAGPPVNRSARHTPSAKDRTPAGLNRPGSVRRPNVLTPHARAAIRDLELRRAAALTPAKDRRRSGRQQRETPRDILRQLSKVLAPGTNPTELSPATEPSAQYSTFTPRNVAFDEGPDLVRPDLSIPLADEDNDDSMLLPPLRTPGIDDDNHTQQSIEMPRRAMSEQVGDRFSLGSYGSMTMNDRLGDLSTIGLDALPSEISEPSFLPANLEDYEEPTIFSDAGILSETTVPLRQGFHANDPLSVGSNRTSDIRPTALVDDDTENTFMLSMPPRDSIAERVSLDMAPRTGNSSEPDDDDIADEEEMDVTQNSVNNYEVLGRSILSPVEEAAQHRNGTNRNAKKVKVSNHGLQYTSLPAGVVKKLSTTFLRTGGSSTAKISKETLEAIIQASDWFFEQISDDLGTYANHAGRKTIDESDVITLMKRQRQTSANITPFALAQKYLPRELLQDVRMARPLKARKRKLLEKIDEAYEE